MWNVRIASVWGIPIRVNVSLFVFLPVLAWLIGSGAQIALYTDLVNTFAPQPLEVETLTAGTTPWLIGVAAAVGLFLSVAVHELGHAWMGRRYGVHTESITLWILGGIASLSAIPREWNREFWIAVAGPGTSVLFAGVCYGLVLALPASTPVATFVFGWLVVTNLLLTAFNLLPAFPMDGGRVLRALLARTRSYASATRTAARIGSGFAILFAVVGVLGFNPILLLLALFLYGAANGESRIVVMETLLEGQTAADVMAREIHTVDADATVSALVDTMLAEQRTTYPVVDGGTVVGVVDLQDLRRARNRDQDTVTVREVMDERVVAVEPATGAFEVMMTLSQARADVAVVEAPDGTAVGLITPSEIGTAMQIRQDGDVLEPKVAM